MPHDGPSTRPPAAAAGGVPLRLVVLPTEHGGWSFLFEPILLGLLVAWSASGALLALAAIAAFLARQPLKLWASDRMRGKIYPRTRLAERAFAVLALLGAGALAGALVLARGNAWPALVGGAVLGAMAIAFDLDKRSREAAAEIAGALALGAVAAAIALAAGWGRPAAFGLWGVLAARAVPTIMYVRARLRLEKGQPARFLGAVLGSLLAIGWAVALARLGVAPWYAVAAMAMLAVRCLIGLSRWRPRMKTWQLGVNEIVFGLITVLWVAFGVRRG